MDDTTNHKCVKCSKTFTEKRNLTRHVKSIHENQNPYECGICSRTFSRKQHKELHLRTCSGNVNIQGGKLYVKSYKTIPNLKFSPTLRQSAFRGIASDWMIYFPEDYYMVDPTILLKEATNTMKGIIMNQLYKHTKKLKFTMSIHVVFEKANDPEVKTVPPVVLTTHPYIVYLGTDIDNCLNDAAEDLFKRIENYEGCGSGWVIDHLVRLDTGIYSF